MVRMTDLVRGIQAGPPPAAGVGLEGEGLLTELRGFLSSAAAGIAAGESFPWDALDDVLDRLAGALEMAADLFWSACDPARPAAGDSLAWHQARVAVMAMRLGACLGYDRWRLVELGTAACLMDIGLRDAPAGALEREHPDRSADIVRQLRPSRPGLADVVRQHHEREGGQGFPRGLPGPALHADARLLGLVDHYATLTAPSTPRLAMGPHEAVRDVLAGAGELFAPGFVRAFVSEISIFPPGTLVRLSSGERGRVCAVNRERALSPRVMVTVDAAGVPLAAPAARDLSAETALHIAGVFPASVDGDAA